VTVRGFVTRIARKPSYSWFERSRSRHLFARPQRAATVRRERGVGAGTLAERARLGGPQGSSVEGGPDGLKRDRRWTRKDPCR
jgi:hypothetical protein